MGTTSQVKYLSDQNPDGTKWSPEPRTDPRQAPVQLYPAGQIVTYQQTVQPATIATITTAEKSITIGTTAGNGLVAATDFLLAVNKPTTLASVGVHTGRISADNTVLLTLSNISGGTLTPTSQVYNVTAIRGVPWNSQTLTPTKIAANSTSEQIFTIAPTDAVITLSVNSDGSLKDPVLVSGGANYYAEPTVVVTDASGGVGAVLRAKVNTSGAVTQIDVLDRGLGYGAPTAKCVGGNVIAPGMFPFVVKPTCDAGVAICNVRIPAKGQIAITYVNPTAAAVTPTSEAYKILALSDVPAIYNIVSYGVIATSIGTFASITSSEATLTVTGLLATDIVVGVQKPALTAGLGLANARAAANALYVGMINATTGTLTPTTTEIYGVTVLTQCPVTPFKIFRALLTPASVAATVSAEQTFTVTGLTYTNSSAATVVVSKPTHQFGLAIAGCRVSASDTLAINFMNVSAAAIVPTAETYDIGCFNVPGPGTSNWVALPFAQSLQRAVEKVNEIGANLQVKAIQKGA